jgi:5-methylcytosine-specific restriction endonuclease McrA
MAKNTNKRIPVKWVRDRAKAAYEKQQTCYVCGTTHDLELHHLHSITVLLETWAQHCGYDISTDEGILAVRDEFIAEHHSELYEQVYTLCNRHHVALHGVYGKTPKPGSEPKQQHWIERQREKHQVGGEVIPKQNVGGFFSEFC